MAKSRRPYLIRAIYEWSADNGYTPHLLVAADGPGVTVPREYVREGRITLNISPMAVQTMDLTRDPIRFSARFGGHPFEVEIPTGMVLAIFAKENGEGIVFGEIEPPDPESQAKKGPTTPGRPKLRVVK